jgi:hypothetical protein
MDMKPTVEYEVVNQFSRLNLQDRQEVTVEMITWNTNCSKGGGYFAAIRDTLIRIVKKPTKHCITFLQELKVGDEAVKKIWNFGDECEVAKPPKVSAGFREAAVATSPSGKKIKRCFNMKLVKLKI